ncbi:MAG TPA: hypothetical protein VMB76_10000 [Casimicrobiaceae bacterium]|jgi:hypothetical protein|nr:hypothetical protein [Casimicrobiaceae bacterium]
MRSARIAPAVTAMLLAACGTPAPDCTSLGVQRNLSTLVRERVLRAELDSAAVEDAPTRGRIDMATSVIIEQTRQTGGDARRALCSATLAIEGMGPDLRSIVRSETDVSYWVAVDDGGGFFVGLMYSDLEAVAAAHTTATWAGRDRPSPR